MIRWGLNTNAYRYACGRPDSTVPSGLMLPLGRKRVSTSQPSAIHSTSPTQAALSPSAQGCGRHSDKASAGNGDSNAASNSKFFMHSAQWFTERACLTRIENVDPSALCCPPTAGMSRPSRLAGLIYGKNLSNRRLDSPARRRFRVTGGMILAGPRSKRATGGMKPAARRTFIPGDAKSSPASWFILAAAGKKLVELGSSRSSQ